eukprot:gb/GEZN01003106.1/.p1 GENE.gb/GEZN01003106.1/~~gb/GEZN01003106.1/.p1  ORF type:complete len:620 (+),score=112.74 gb/GEZN01003106.1/:67-1926(+)
MSEVTKIFCEGWLIEKRTYITFQEFDLEADKETADKEIIKHKPEKLQTSHTKWRKEYFILEENGLFTFDKEFDQPKPWSKFTTEEKQKFLSADKENAKEEGKAFAAWVARLDKVGKSDMKLLCTRGLGMKTPTRDMLSKVDESYMKDICKISQPPIIQRTLKTLKSFTVGFDAEAKTKTPPPAVLGFAESIASFEKLEQASLDAGGKPNCFKIKCHPKPVFETSSRSSYILMAFTEAKQKEWLEALPHKVTKAPAPEEVKAEQSEKSEEAFGTIADDLPVAAASHPGFLTRVRSVSRSTIRSPSPKTSFRAAKIFKQDGIIQRVEVVGEAEDPTNPKVNVESKYVGWRKRYLIIEDGGIFVFNKEMIDWNLKTEDEKEICKNSLSKSVQVMEGEEFQKWVKTLDKFGQKDMTLITAALKTEEPSRAQIDEVDEHFVEHVMRLTQPPVRKRILQTLDAFKKTRSGGEGEDAVPTLIQFVSPSEAATAKMEELADGAIDKPNCFQLQLKATEEEKDGKRVIFMCLVAKERLLWLKALTSLQKHAAKLEPASPGSLSRSNSSSLIRSGSGLEGSGRGSSRGLLSRVRSISFSSKGGGEPKSGTDTGNHSEEDEHEPVAVPQP